MFGEGKEGKNCRDERRGLKNILSHPQTRLIGVWSFLKTSYFNFFPSCYELVVNT